MSLTTKQRLFLEELILSEMNAISTGGGALTSTGAMTGYQGTVGTNKATKKTKGTRPFFPDIEDGEPVSKSPQLHGKKK